MHYHYHELFKNRYQHIPTETDAILGARSHTDKDYLLDQYDRENLFLNKQVEELLYQNKLLKKAQTLTQFDLHSSAAFSKDTMRLREKQRKTLADQEKVKEAPKKPSSNRKGTHSSSIYTFAQEGHRHDTSNFGTAQKTYQKTKYPESTAKNTTSSARGN